MSCIKVKFDVKDLSSSDKNYIITTYEKIFFNESDIDDYIQEQNEHPFIEISINEKNIIL